MRFIGLFSLAVASAILIGCSSGSTKVEVGSGTAATPVVDKKQLTGSWKGDIKMPEPKKNDPGADLGQAMAKMFTAGLKLNFPDEGHFKLTLMGMPVEGDVARTGDSLTLTPQKFMGMTPEEAKKSSTNPTSEDFGKPIEGSISADGVTITLKGKKAEEGEMVFVRDTGATTEVKKVGTPTVTGDESAVVGSYAADMSTLDESKLTADQKKDLPMMKAAMSSAAVELFADNTFKLTIVIEMEGKWKMEGGKVRLDPTKALGMDAGKDAKNDPLFFEPRDGKLWIQPTKPGDPSFAFVKK